MWSVALLNLPDDGAQAALHVIDLKQGPQRLVDLFCFTPSALAISRFALTSRYIAMCAGVIPSFGALSK
ncbi:hypothetical protein D9M71_606040 [compost metagenome]